MVDLVVFVYFMHSLGIRTYDERKRDTVGRETVGVSVPRNIVCGKRD